LRLSRKMATGLLAVASAFAMMGASASAATWTDSHSEGYTLKTYILESCGVEGCSPQFGYTAVVGGYWEISWTGSKSGYATMAGTYPICQQGTVYNTNGSWDGVGPVPLSGELDPHPSVSWTDGSYGSTGSFVINQTDDSCFLESPTWAFNSGESNNTGQKLYFPDLHATAQVKLDCPSYLCVPTNGRSSVSYTW
jgi:hypothetical protein